MATVIGASAGGGLRSREQRHSRRSPGAAGLTAPGEPRIGDTGRRVASLALAAAGGTAGGGAAGADWCRARVRCPRRRFPPRVWPPEPRPGSAPDRAELLPPPARRVLVRAHTERHAKVHLNSSLFVRPSGSAAAGCHSRPKPVAPPVAAPRPATHRPHCVGALCARNKSLFAGERAHADEGERGRWAMFARS